MGSECDRERLFRAKKKKFNRSMMLESEQHWLHDKKAKKLKVSLCSRARKGIQQKVTATGTDSTRTVMAPRTQDASCSNTCLALLTFTENAIVSLANCGFSVLALDNANAISIR